MGESKYMKEGWRIALLAFTIKAWSGQIPPTHAEI